MMNWIKRVRGSLGIGLTWAITWTLVGGVLGPVFGPELIAWIDPGMYASIGFLTGGMFSIGLGIAGRRRTFNELSLRYFAIGGALPPLFWLAVGNHWVVPLGAGTFLAFLGAGSATGSLAIARMADHEELLESIEWVAQIGPKHP